jgi:hypothetical protein
MSNQQRHCLLRSLRVLLARLSEALRVAHSHLNRTSTSPGPHPHNLPDHPPSPASPPPIPGDDTLSEGRVTPPPAPEPDPHTALERVHTPLRRIARALCESLYPGVRVSRDVLALEALQVMIGMLPPSPQGAQGT